MTDVATSEGEITFTVREWPTTSAARATISRLHSTALRILRNGLVIGHWQKPALF